jgi:hypothetical protein
MIAEHSLDLLLLTETWIPPSASTAEKEDLAPNGYSVNHVHRPQGRGGGLAVIASEKISISTSPISLLPTTFEVQNILVKLSSTKFILCNIYRPPHPHLSNFLLELADVLECISTADSPFMVAGDFNWPASRGDALFNLAQSFGLIQLVSSPTRNDEILDLIFVSNDFHSFVKGNVIDVFFSDHKLVTAKFTCPRFNQLPSTSKTFCDFSAVNPNILRIALSDILTVSSSFICPESLLAYVTSNISECVLKFVPVRIKKKKRHPQRPN